MKNKYIYVLIVIIIFIIMTGVIAYDYFKKQTSQEYQEIIQGEDFIYIDVINDERLTNSDTYKDKVFTNYLDFTNMFNSDKLTKENFINNNYVLIPINYNACNQSDVTPVRYTINGNNINVLFNYYHRCGICENVIKFYVLKVSKQMINVNLEIKKEEVGTSNCNANVSYKPLLYLYPEKEMNIKVILGYEELLTSTYPKYNNEWNVLAKPNGDLIDENNRTYYGLYWEGISKSKTIFNDGFVVEKDNIETFLEEKLKILGLNERESNEFIIYWLPKLQENEYNLIKFESIENINNDMPLYISPEPDTVIRVLMKYIPLDYKIQIPEQKLQKVERSGFSVIEWGGSIITDNYTIIK